MEREEKADTQPDTAIVTSDGTSDPKRAGKKSNKTSRSRSRRRTVSYDGGKSDFNDDFDADTSATELLRRRKEQDQTSSSGDARTTDSLDPSFLSPTVSPKSVTFSEQSQRPQSPPIDSVLVNGKSQNRPAADGKLFPFKLAKSLGDEGANPSTVTLKSYAGVTTPHGAEGETWKPFGEEAGGEGKGDDDDGGETSAAATGESTPKPELERFETAREGL